MEIYRQKYYVVKGMTTIGGYFMQTIGKALGTADPENTYKIKKTWPEDWERFLEAGIKLDERARKVKICRACGMSDDETEPTACLVCGR